MIFSCSPKHVFLQEFQYKIIHRYYPCDSKVAKWDKTVDAICKLCKVETANILHIFYNCKHSKDFWASLNIWLNHNNISNPQQSIIEAKIIILGIIPSAERSHALNHCLIYGKFFIHTCRKKNTTPTLPHFKLFYKRVLQAEKERLWALNKNWLFRELFQKLYDNL